MDLYSQTGEAVAYLANDRESIYLYDGTPVAYIDDDAIYTYSGRILGWFLDGWIRDVQGKAVFSTDVSSGPGPARPVRQVKPEPGPRRERPARGARQLRPVPPIATFSWSPLSSQAFFS